MHDCFFFIGKGIVCRRNVCINQISVETTQSFGLDYGKRLFLINEKLYLQLITISTLNKNLIIQLDDSLN